MQYKNIELPLSLIGMPNTLLTTSSVIGGTLPLTSIRREVIFDVVNEIHIKRYFFDCIKFKVEKFTKT
jgi:hypothetical protein